MHFSASMETHALQDDYRPRPRSHPSPRVSSGTGTHTISTESTTFRMDSRHGRPFWVAWGPRNRGARGPGTRAAGVLRRHGNLSWVMPYIRK